MSTATKKHTKQAWSASDRQRFADRNILKSKKIAAKRKPAPTAKEWDA